MIKTMWDAKAVKAYETGQGVELVNEPYPHYEPVKAPECQISHNHFWIEDLWKHQEENS